MTAADDAPAPRHRSILTLLLAALLLLGVAVPGPGPAHPRDPAPALSQESGPHVAAAHPLPLADAPGEIRISRPNWCIGAVFVAVPAELDRPPVPAEARAPPDC